MTHKLLWDFDIHTDHLISAVPPDYRIKLKECEKKDKYLNLARELKKLWNMKVTIIPIVIGAFGTVTKKLLKGTGGFGSWRMCGDYPNDSIIENSQNTEKSPGDLRRLAVTQTPAGADVKNSKGVDNNNKINQHRMLMYHQWMINIDQKF